MTSFAAPNGWVSETARYFLHKIPLPERKNGARLRDECGITLSMTNRMPCRRRSTHETRQHTWASATAERIFYSAREWSDLIPWKRIARQVRAQGPPAAVFGQQINCHWSVITECVSIAADFIALRKCSLPFWGERYRICALAHARDATGALAAVNQIRWKRSKVFWRSGARPERDEILSRRLKPPAGPRRDNMVMERPATKSLPRCRIHFQSRRKAIGAKKK